MIRKEQRIRLIVLFTIFSIIFIGVGYAIFTTSLNINGTVDVDKTDWDVHFENLQIVEDTTGDARATIRNTNTVVDYTVSLEKPGDTFSFTVDVVNDGTVDAMIGVIAPSGLTEEQEKYINYNVHYDDDIELELNQELESKDTKTIIVEVEYDYNSDILLEEPASMELELDIQYVKIDYAVNYCKNNKKTTKTNPVCKRAVNLHVEECPSSSYKCYDSGYYSNGSKGTTSIIYGNCGTSGVISSGDAFDCDVDNSGTFDEDERFYYVSPTDTDENSEYAVLIYYKSIAVSEYNTKNSYTGPKNAYEELPSTKEWSNSKLNTNMTRQIKNQLGGTTTNGGANTITQFTYRDSAARFLTTQELEYACGKVVDAWPNDRLDSCIYLEENTNYAGKSAFTPIQLGWWLETPAEDNKTYYQAFNVSNANYVPRMNTSLENEVRPAIEVKYEDIDY